jgi:hypothetical protein
MAHLGKSKSRSTREKMSVAQLGNQNKKGKPVSFETRVKLSEAMKGNQNRKCHKQ